MYWKYELPDDGEVQSVASYKPDSEIVYYYNNNLADRVVLTPSFAGKFKNLLNGYIHVLKVLIVCLTRCLIVN